MAGNMLYAVLSLLVAMATGQTADPLAVGATIASGPQQLNISFWVPLPVLPTLSGSVTVVMAPTVIRGPGDNTSSADPYVEFVGRTFNTSFVPGVIRITQGESMRLKVCNDLPAEVATGKPELDAYYNVPRRPSEGAGVNGFRDPNIMGNHLHGFVGNPGTSNIPCDLAPADGTPCYRGDNVFAEILPGNCTEYQYDVNAQHSPGLLWIHPHHHGAASLQTQQASIPVVVDVKAGGVADPLATESCAPLRQYFDPANEIIMHMQTMMMAVDRDGSGPGTPITGPTDDAYIAVGTKSNPEDPYCCLNEANVTDAGSSWLNATDLEGTGTELEPISLVPFTTSGPNAQFTLINGVYQPIVELTAGEVYQFRFVQAATMRWMDLAFNQSGCNIGLYNRDATMLHTIPRMTDHIFMSAANRADALVSCAPGVYSLSTGYGLLEVQPDCLSSHCMPIQQEVLATIVVTAAPGRPTTPPVFEACQPTFPTYLQDLRNATDAKQHGIMNFTNPTLGGDPADVVPSSAGCGVNGLLFMDSAPMQETIGDLLELQLENIDVHPYHHHTQPFQIIALPNATNASDPGAWQVGDWVDTLLLPQLSKSAVVRWTPGPVNLTGTGFGLLHCHILPHEDEGCMMKTQILDRQYMTFSGPRIRHGGVAGITLASLAGAAIVIWGIVFLKRKHQRSKWQTAHQQPLTTNAVEP